MADFDCEKLGREDEDEEAEGYWDAAALLKPLLYAEGGNPCPDDDSLREALAPELGPPGGGGAALVGNKPALPSYCRGLDTWEGR